MDIKKIDRVTIIGAGVMGPLIAWICVKNGITVFLYDISAAQIDKAVDKVKGLLAQDFKEQAQVESMLAYLQPVNDLKVSLKSTDLAFETITENLTAKIEIHTQIGKLASKDMLIGSNTSSIPCTPLAQASGRPDKFFNMNFSDPRYESLTELMGSPQTNATTLKAAENWARRIGMVPILVRKEIMGYVFNRIWRAIKREALYLVDQGYSTPEDIDKAFMLTFKTEDGPFGMMDQIGLDTVKLIEMQYYEASSEERDKPPKLLCEMVSKGLLGEKTGEGFYSWPEPAYKRSGWLSE